MRLANWPLCDIVARKGAGNAPHFRYPLISPSRSNAQLHTLLLNVTAVCDDHHSEQTFKERILTHNAGIVRPLHSLRDFWLDFSRGKGQDEARTGLILHSYDTCRSGQVPLIDK